MSRRKKFVVSPAKVEEKEVSTDDLILDFPRAGLTSLVVNRQNHFDNIWRNTTGANTMNIRPFTKEDYLRVAQEKTTEFVHSHFGETLRKTFAALNEAASKRRHCHHEVKFEVPDPYDVNKTEETLRSYFRGLKYEVIAEPRKGDTNIIVLTLT